MHSRYGRDEDSLCVGEGKHRRYNSHRGVRKRQRHDDPPEQSRTAESVYAMGEADLDGTRGARRYRSPMKACVVGIEERHVRGEEEGGRGEWPLHTEQIRSVREVIDDV